MLKKIFTLIKLLLPYRPSEEEVKFAEENKKYWTKRSGEAKILVETYVASPASLLEKFIIAKKLEQKLDGETIATIHGLYKRSSAAYPVAQSFSIGKYICIWRDYLNPWIFLQCLVETLILIKGTKDGDKLVDLHVKGIHIGDLLYDSLIRHIPQTYTVTSLSLPRHFRLVFRAIFNLHFYLNIFEKNNVKAVVTSHTVYAEFGILCRIAHNNGAFVFLKDMDVFRVYRPDSNIYEHFLKVSNDELGAAIKNSDVVQAAEEYFAERMNGNIDQVDVINAFSNSKRKYTRVEILEQLDLSPNKKNVFVLAHAFSDAPHVGGKLAFQDYYVWLRESLKQLSLNDKVNVFVKPHPSSYMWGEKGAVETLLEQQKIKNVHITPSDMNTSSICDIADYVVTARGTAGLEFSGLGIPAITCGEGYYSGFGLSAEIFDRGYYLAHLSKLPGISRLSTETATKARVLLYLTFSKLQRSSIAPSRHIYPGDDAATLKPLNYKEMLEKLTLMKTFDDAFSNQVNAEINNAV